jgi:predicted RNA-binding protein with PIN domain
MPIIIDGWNLIRDRNSLLRDQEPLQAASALLSRLQSFQSRHSDPIVVVFDSSNEYLEIPYRNTSKMKIIPTPDADDYIKRYLDQVPANQRRNYRVISSDLSVYDYARSSSAQAIRCGEFWNRLQRN